MELLSGKAVDGQLPAAEWNGRSLEEQNLVTAWIALSGTPGDNQLGQAIAAYAAASHFYTCTGGADVYTATPLAGIQAPPAHSVGFLLRFRPSTNNTGPSTVNVAALGIKNIVREDGSALQALDLVTIRDAWCRYDGAVWVLSDWSSAQSVAGADLQASHFVGYLTRTSASVITLSKGIGGTIEIVINGVKLSRTADLTFTLSGAGGDIDTGTEAASTAYYLYIENVGGVMTPSVSVTAPDIPGGTKPGYKAGDADNRCIGGQWNNTSSDLCNGRWSSSGKFTLFQRDSDHEYAIGSSDTSNALNIPHVATEVYITAAIEGDSGGAGDRGMCLSADGFSTSVDDTLVSNNDVQIWLHVLTNAEGTTSVMQGTIPITTMNSPAFQSDQDGTEASSEAIVNGWDDIYAPKS